MYNQKFQELRKVHKEYKAFRLMLEKDKERVVALSEGSRSFIPLENLKKSNITVEIKKRRLQ